MKFIGAGLIVMLFAGKSFCGESLDLGVARVFADKIEKVQQEGDVIIKATGSAYLILNVGHFSGYSFASIETPISLNLESKSVSCSGWFVATNGEENFHFGEELAKPPSIVFHADGRRSGIGYGVILNPTTQIAKEKKARQSKLIREAFSLVERHKRQGEQEKGHSGPDRPESK